MKLKVLFFILFSIAIISSCFKEPKGFPDKIVFGPEGEERVYTGYEFGAIEITHPTKGICLMYSDRYGYEHPEDTARLAVEFDWLRVTGNYPYGKSLTISVKPNTTGKKREFVVWPIQDGCKSAGIRVIQTGGL